MIREVISHNRYYLIGTVFLGIAAAFFQKQGAVDYAADRVWEEADAMTRRQAEAETKE